MDKFQKFNIRDNENPRAYIGIMISHTFFYFAMKSVYKNLPHAEFIFDTDAFPLGFRCPEWYKNRIRQTLNKEGVHWRDFETANLPKGEFFSKYNTLVAPFFEGYMRFPENKHKKKVRVFYGTAKDSWAFGLWNAYFNLVLCPSDFYTNKMNNLYGKIAKTTGEPKLDALSEPRQDNFLEENGIHLDPLKKTILYAPTWGELSTDDVIIPELLLLLNNFNVIYKPHHMTAMLRSEFVDGIKRSTDIHVALEDVSLMQLLKIDAVVLSDNSGAIFDTIHSGKPFVLIDKFGDSMEKVYSETPFFTYAHGKFKGVATTAESLEQIIKKDGSEIAPVVRTFNKSEWSNGSLKDALLRAIGKSNDEIYTKRQVELKSKYFQQNDGFSGKRAADAIMELVNNEYPPKSEIAEHISGFEKKIRDVTLASPHHAQIASVGARDEIERIKKLPYYKRVREILDIFFSHE